MLSVNIFHHLPTENSIATAVQLNLYFQPSITKKIPILCYLNTELPDANRAVYAEVMPVIYAVQGLG